MNKLKKDTARGNFKELLGGDVTPTIQKVHPTKETKASNNDIELTQLMVWIPTELMIKIKTKTVLEKRSMKDIITELLEAHL